MRSFFSIVVLCLLLCLLNSSFALTPTPSVAPVTPTAPVSPAASVTPAVPVTSSAPTPVTPAAGQWHGFDRYDFILDEKTMSITPFNPPTSEGEGFSTPPDGQRRCILIMPKQMADGHPWSWRGCYWDHMPQAEVALLNHGFCIAYISVKGKPDQDWDAWYAYLVKQYGLSSKPAFIGMSRGGQFAYDWATTHPDEVSCIYADNPAASESILAGLGELAKHDVPLLHVCGSLDPLLGRCTIPIETIYQQFGGRISIMIKEGFAHHPHSLNDPTPIVDFFEQTMKETAQTPPDFVPAKYDKTSYYGNQNSYVNYPQDGAYMTCRGPFFTPCYDRYSFSIDGLKGSGGLNIIVPQKPAAGNPWVFRSDFVNRDEIIDQALLAKGYYIVTGPVPFNIGPVQAQWDASYDYLTSHGFSKKPVMEGDGGAAGEAYAWASANPDKVSCIYSVNPIMHSNLAKVSPIDNLAPLAKAGIPLLNLCGSLDPGLNDNTKVVEKRYQDMGGKITVIVEDNVGHYLEPVDPKPVLDFITQSVSK